MAETDSIIAPGIVVAGQPSVDVAFANYFMDRFVSTYSVNLVTRSFRVYKRMERLEKDYPVIPDYVESLKTYATREIHADDQVDFLEFIQPENLRVLMREKLTETHNFRVIANADELTYSLRVIRGADENNVVFAFLDITEDMRRERERKQATVRAKVFERMTGDDGVFIIDCVNDTRRTVHDYCRGAGKYSDGEKQSESFSRYIDTCVAKVDRERMRKFASPAYMLAQLGNEDEYSVEYRDVTTGIQRFYEMRVARYSDTEVLLSFKEKDREIINRLMLSRLEEDYYAIFGADLETGLLQVLKDQAKQVLGEEGAVRSYETAMMEFSSHYSGEARMFFEKLASIEYLKRRFARDNQATFVFKTYLSDEKWRSVTLLVLTRRDDGSPSLFVIAFNRLDDEAGDKAELQQHLQEALEVAEGANRRNETLHQILRSAQWSVFFNENREVTRCEFSPALKEVLHNDFNDNDGWIALTHPEDRDRTLNEAFAALRDETGKTIFDTEYRVLSRDGEYHWVRTAGRVIPDPRGGGEMYGICIDIDDSVRRRKEEQRILDEAHAMERANEAKSHFFSMVSHDIRTPLNAIIGYAELLKLGISDEKERAKAVNSVLVSGHSLLELINDVLDLSKLEAGKMELSPEPVDVRLLTKEIADAFKASIVGKNIEIRAVAKPMPWLRIDPHRIRQILFNLVGNAVKFTEKGYVEIKAEYVRDPPAPKGLGALPKDGRAGAPSPAARGTLTFEVRDTGCGMTEEQQLHIADPYVQFGSSAARNKGTGLGIAICNQLVAIMGGEIELESKPKVGTLFRVILPGVEEEDATRRARLSATQRIQFAVAGGNSRKFSNVLVVDDQTMNRMVLKNMLVRFGVENIAMAENGVEALSRMKSGRFDLVLTDMWMPEMDGEGLIREIRKNPVWADLPVYAITADVEARKNSAELGFTGILLKPVTIEKLKEIFEN